MISSDDREIVQAARAKMAYSTEFVRASWSPPVRVVGTLLGTWLTYEGVRSRGFVRTGLIGAGAMLVLRSATNHDLIPLLGLLFRPVVDLRRSVELACPIDAAYEFWRDFSNYPRFMSFISEVRLNEEGGLRWVAAGPGGIPVNWDAYVTALDRNERISWESTAASNIANRGKIEFVPLPGDRTRVDIELEFAPPAGALGYAVAHFLGFDPASRFDSDLDEMRRLVESQAASSRAGISF